MKTYQLTATALPSCVLYPSEAEQVKKIKVTVEMQFSQMGKRNRWKIINKAFEELRRIAPQFHGCKQSVGGMLSGEPKLKGGGL